MSPRIDAGGLSDPGRVRPNNQDQFLIADLEKSMVLRATSLPDDSAQRCHDFTTGTLAIVADGMGGHAGGETASAIAIEELEHFVLNTLPWCFRLHGQEDRDFEEELKDGFLRCQRRIEAAASQRPNLQDMGTTLTMAYVVWPRLYVVHVGDSRCYLLRGDRLSQLTTDHTVAQKLVEDGTLEPEEARASRYNSVLWNALGGGVSELQPQVIRATLRPADTLVLCSDGLTAHVPDDRIRDILAEDRSAQDASAELVRLANEGGGQDNITVVVARVGGDRVVKTPLEFSAVDTQTIEIPWSTLAAG